MKTVYNKSPLDRQMLWDGTATGGQFYFALFLALVAGYSVNFIGTIYVADLLSMIFGVWGAISLFSRHHSIFFRQACLGIALCLFAFIYLALDIFNAISVSDFARGFARNLLFGLSFCGWMWIIFLYGFKRFLIIYIVLGLSSGVLIGLGVATDFNYRENNFINFIKYNGGTSLVLFFFYFFSGRRLVLFACLCAWSILMIFYTDSRAGAALAILAASLVGLTRLTAGFNSRIIVLIFAILLPGSAYVLSNMLVDERFISSEKIIRRADSNRQRLDMFEFANAEIVARPLTGYGSWQSAARYVDPVYTDMYVPIHSVVLQYLYEYGVFGLFYPIAILVITVWSFARSVIFVKSVNWGHGFIIYFIIIGQLMNLFLGGLSGFTRFLVSGSLAVSVFLVGVELSGRIHKRPSLTKDNTR